MISALFSKRFILLFLSATIFLLLAGVVSARIGVGVGTGKIEVDEPLNPGTLYELPSITVINTGDVSGEYELDVTYHEQQAQQRPAREWFTYTPSSFSLEPGEAKEVFVKLVLPVKTTPGKYFAYLEARPIATTTSTGGAQIGIAAASKLYFDVAPANFIQGIWYRVVSLWQQYTPFPQIALGTIFFLVLLKFIKSKISLDISIKPKKKNQTEDTDVKNDY